MGHATSEVVMRETVGRGIESGEENEELTEIMGSFGWVGRSYVCGAEGGERGEGEGGRRERFQLLCKWETRLGPTEQT